MVRECIEQRYRSYGLHRLGITMHVFADTWAHQGFAGVSHEVNSARDLVDGNNNPDQSLMNRLKGFFIGGALPLGHGTVLSNPDRPYLRWGYTNGRGEKITRDNPKDFLTAANEMCKAMQRYRLGDPAADVPGLPIADRQNQNCSACWPPPWVKLPTVTASGWPTLPRGTLALAQPRSAMRPVAPSPGSTRP
jgi:hypothetical protein